MDAGTAQIQSVPQNAAAANAAAVAAGEAPPYDVDFIQSVADQQSQAFAGDNAVIWQSDPASPSTWPWYYWAGIVGVGMFLWLTK